MPNIPNTNTRDQILTSVGDGSNASVWSSASGTSYLKSVWSVQGALVVPSGSTGNLPPDLMYVPSGITRTLIQVFAIIEDGTSVTLAVQQNGSAVAGLSAIVVAQYSSVAAMTYNPTNPTIIANGDRIRPVIASLSATPGDLSLAVIYQDVA